MKMPLPLLAGGFALVTCLAACSGEAKSPVDYAALTASFRADPSSPKVDNPVTPEKVALGKLLYHETKLSKKKNLSCASCHSIENYGQDGLPTSPGTDGVNGGRNTPSSLNAFRHFAQFWDGRAATVEEQATGPILNPVEHGVKDAAELIGIIEGIDGMKEKFAKAFPDETPALTFENVGKAIAAFERGLVTTGRWDAFRGGDHDAFSEAEVAGLKEFVTVGCTTCHMFSTVGGGMFQKLGLVKPYESKDLGRFEVTKQEADKFMFKVPSLLNIEKTAPYFHDGSVKTLPEAVKLMASHQLGKDLSAAQVESIVTFLKALTGELPKY